MHVTNKKWEFCFSKLGHPDKGRGWIIQINLQTSQTQIQQIWGNQTWGNQIWGNPTHKEFFKKMIWNGHFYRNLTIFDSVWAQN